MLASLITDSPQGGIFDSMGVFDVLRSYFLDFEVLGTSLWALSAVRADNVRSI